MVIMVRTKTVSSFPIRGLILCVAILVMALSISASFTSDMEMLAMNMAKSLGLTPHQSISMTVLPEDKAYMLPLSPVYNELKKYLQAYTHTITFNTFRGRDNAVIREMVLSGSYEYKPFGFHEKSVDSLILYGTCFLDDADKDRMCLTLTVIDIRANRLFQSNEVVLNKHECPASIARGLFAAIADKQVFRETVFKGRIITELDRLFNSAHNNLLAYPAQYRFEKKHPYALQWQVDLLKETLSLKYGITLNKESVNTIRIEPTGAVVFTRENNERGLDRIIDGEPLLPVQFLEEYDSLYYLYSTMNQPVSHAAFEAKPWKTGGEKSVHDQIYTVFHSYYPQLFTTGNFPALDRIFVDKGHPSILVGSKLVSDPATGKEVVAYSWHSKQSWLAALKRAHQERNRTFNVDTYVLGIFSDNLDPNRYWAIVVQKWRTKDLYGNCVYADDGFLIVNFDFDTHHKLKEFAIHYRLWFYNYQYHDREAGISRYDKLVYDLDRYFVNGLGGIDSTLKKGMRDFLIRKIRTISSQIKEKSDRS